LRKGEQMTESSRERGWEKLEQVDGEAGGRVVEIVGEIAPDLDRCVIGSGLGELYSHPVLRVGGALDVGATREEVAPTRTFLTPFVGSPRVLNAVFATKEIFTDPDDGPHAETAAKGLGDQR
jgi:4-carboxymuconolactone decarboxylase